MSTAQTEVATGKKTPARLKSYEEMTPEERQAFDKKTAAQQAEYSARLLVQKAKDDIQAAQKQRTAEIEAAKLRTRNNKEEQRLTRALRAGEVDAVAVGEAVKALNLPSEQFEAMTKRIIEAATKNVRTPSAKSIPAPSFTLSYGFAMMSKAQFVQPDEGSKPDAYLSASVQRLGIVSPFLVRPGEGVGRFTILDGKRRYFLIKDGETVPAVIVTGFPDETTEEIAEVAVNRVRSLNPVSTANIISRMRTRGKSDSDLRRDMGFKTGEVDKYASLLTLPASFRGLLNSGELTPSVALFIAKQPPSVIARIAEKATATPGARITEAMVEEARRASSEEVIKRDAPLLSEAMSSTPGDVANPSTGAEDSPSKKA